MGAGGLPGEADYDRGYMQCRRDVAGALGFPVPLADPASALRAVLSDPAGRDALREMGYAEVAAIRDMLEVTYSPQGGCDASTLHPADALDRWLEPPAVDALASGVEGDAGTKGKGR